MEIIQVVEKFAAPDCKEVESIDEILPLMEPMINLCEQYNGIGLAAPQVGIYLKFFIAKIRNEWRFFVNPKYKQQPYSRKIFNIEGCLSLNYGRDKYYVPRWDLVSAEGAEYIKGKKKFQKYIDFKMNEVALVYQHECDHLNNIFIKDFAEKYTPGMEIAKEAPKKRGRKKKDA